MYTLTRQEVADELGISTRSIDRYIKSGKLRSKKQGKIVYVNNKDVENLKSSGNNYQEVIVPKKKKMKEEIVIKKNEKDSFGLESVYIDLREQIKEKDELIQKLSLSLGKSEEIIKNSISLIDYKKSQFLLEESKGYLSKEIESLQEEKEVLLKELKYEKSSNVILIIFTVLEQAPPKG
ncbi:hypothetical protein CSB08_00880 [Candidatus Gracilibacteria bacterium]|nr:MAG: hypothetical protein CSB08_00880 [Candidatus Gracilibacteria bacterium]